MALVSTAELDFNDSEVVISRIGAANKRLLFTIYVLDRYNNLEMAVVCSMTGLYPGKFIFKKTILPISAGQAVCPLPTTEIIFL